MKKVKIVLPLNEKNKKEQNYGYMRPLKTREKNIYKLHSKHWNQNTKKKNGISLVAYFYSCFRKFSKWNSMADAKTQDRIARGPGAAELSAYQLQQLYLCSLLMGKLK